MLSQRHQYPFRVRRESQRIARRAHREWINPHAWIHLDVKGPDGKIVSWMIEGGSPNILLRRGFTKQSLQEGAEIVVEGYQAKNGENRANGANITFKDGKRLFVGGSNPDELPQGAK